MPSSFDGVESISVAECNPSAYPRRLTAETLGALRRRRTGSGSTVRKPLRPEHRREEGVDGVDSNASSGDDDSDDEDDDLSCFDVFCCCWGPRCCVSSCMLIVTLMGWSAAITYGILKQPTYESVVTPIRVAKQRWLTRTPKNAEEGFTLFDRNADGRISVQDMAIVARMTTGEDPTHEQLAAYIAKGDTDGDGTLDEEEYLQLLYRERAEKAAEKAAKEGTMTSESDLRHDFA